MAPRITPDAWQVDSDPIVQTFEAELLETIGAVDTVEDADATDGAAAIVDGVGSGLKLPLPRIRAGVYAIWVCGKPTKPEAAVESEQLKPLYLHLQINSGVGGVKRLHRVRVPLHREGLYEHIGRIYFHAPEERTYEAELSIGQRSQVTQIAIDRVELRDPLGGLTFEPVKAARNLYDLERIRSMRTEAAKAGTLPDPIRAQPLSADRRDELDELLWNRSIIPLNAAGAAAASRLDARTPAILQITSDASRRMGRSIGTWSMPPMSYDQPWSMRHEGLELEYALADYIAGHTLPAPWPFPEDCGGYFFAGADWACERSFNYGTVPRAIERRYTAILAALGAADPPDVALAKHDLPGKYLLLGDLEAAADAAFLLAAYAYRYPGYDRRSHEIDNICDLAGTFEAGNLSQTRGRGYELASISTQQTVDLLRSYDMLFPYIKGNEQLARRLGRFIPWVMTPDDVVKLIDTFLVQRAARDAAQRILDPQVLGIVAEVLAGPVGRHYQDLYRRLAHEGVGPAPAKLGALRCLGSIRRNDDGPILAELVGVKQVKQGNISVTVPRAWFLRSIQSVDGRTGRIELDAPLPADLFVGRQFFVDTAAGEWSAIARQIKGNVITMDRTCVLFGCALGPVADDRRSARIDQVRPAAGAGAPRADAGLVRNEAGRQIGRGSLVADQWFLFTGWPEARLHLGTITPADLTDADADGRVTVTIDAGETEIRLEVASVRDDGYMLFVRKQAQGDAPGPRNGQLIRNEARTRQWRIGFVGQANRLVMDKCELNLDDLLDADQDGRQSVWLDAIGPGDTLRIPAWVRLRQLAQENVESQQELLFELESNTALALMLPGKAAFISRDSGGTWQPLPGDSSHGVLRTDIGEQDLAPGRTLLKVRRPTPG